MTQQPIIIVGGGPAGTATALHLAATAPHLAEHTLVLEAQTYPRPKLCGGGITIHGEHQFEALGITPDVPAFTVNRLVFRLSANHAFHIDYPGAMRVIQRDDFDTALAQAAMQRGIRFHTGERLLDLHPHPQGVTVITDQAEYEAAAVVACDGANSTVRRKLGIHSKVGIARLLRVMTPLDSTIDAQWGEAAAVFDFSCVPHGIQGYIWDFPCYVDGVPTMNRGICDSRVKPIPAVQREEHGALKRVFYDHLTAHGLDTEAVTLEGHPVRWFDPDGVFARPRILFAGDAAGVDPLFAEGISYAMEYGILAAEALTNAFTTDDFSFSTYRNTILAHRMGKLLKRRTAVARALYQHHRYPHMWPMVWRLADIAWPRLQQRIGASLALLPNV